MSSAHIASRDHLLVFEPLANTFAGRITDRADFFEQYDYLCRQYPVAFQQVPDELRDQFMLMVERKARYAS